MKDLVIRGRVVLFEKIYKLPWPGYFTAKGVWGSFGPICEVPWVLNSSNLKPTEVGRSKDQKSAKYLICAVCEVPAPPTPLRILTHV